MLNTLNEVKKKRGIVGVPVWFGKARCLFRVKMPVKYKKTQKKEAFGFLMTFGHIVWTQPALCSWFLLTWHPAAYPRRCRAPHPMIRPASSRRRSAGTRTSVLSGTACATRVEVR